MKHINNGSLKRKSHSMIINAEHGTDLKEILLKQCKGLSIQRIALGYWNSTSTSCWRGLKRVPRSDLD